MNDTKNNSVDPVAEASIMQDPFVMDMMNLMGAQIVEGSIKPIINPEQPVKEQERQERQKQALQAILDGMEKPKLNPFVPSTKPKPAGDLFGEPVPMRERVEKFQATQAEQKPAKKTLKF